MTASLRRAAGVGSAVGKFGLGVSGEGNGDLSGTAPGSCFLGCPRAVGCLSWVRVFDGGWMLIKGV